MKTLTNVFFFGIKVIVRVWGMPWTSKLNLTDPEYEIFLFKSTYRPSDVGYNVATLPKSKVSVQTNVW